MKETRIHMVGNAHLDPAWMWSWEEGLEAFLATVRAALDRMEETSAFVFTCSSAAHYRWIEEVEPELFERVRRAVDEGRWSIVGGWWLQADCNLPSGEGFVRQALLGQRYFIARFGRAARTGYSPDAFGHSRGLPQLLARAGMTGYIFCRPDPTELTLPSPLLDWRTADGSSVLAYRVPFHYNMYETTVPKKVADLVASLDAPSPLTDGTPLGRFGRTWSLFYGVGNHGGGPTREMIGQIEEIDGDASTPRLLFSTPDAFFDDVARERDRREIPVWTDDLQIDAPGCYSAHSQIKKLNRTSEHLLQSAEALASMATALLGIPYPTDELRAAWERVCFNHFHDILCGVATREALDDAVEEYGAALSTAKRVARFAVQRLARSIDTRGEGRTLIVFNPHAWPIDGNVRFELWHDIEKHLWSKPIDIRVTDDSGADIPCQTGFTSGKIGRDRIAVTFGASLPALGWRSYRVFYGERGAGDRAFPGTATSSRIDNGRLRLELLNDGAVAIQFDGRSLVTRGGVGLVIDDATDTWGHGVERFDNVVGMFEHESAELVASGPTHATVRTRSRFGGSRLQQDYTIAAGGEYVEVEVKVVWAEQYRMLKLAFESTVDAPMSVAESAYATTTKPADGRERPCGTWCAVASQEGAPAALAIVSDAKHAFSCAGPELRLTVLRSPSYATHIPHPHDPLEDLDHLDQGVQRFRYRIVPMPGGLDAACLTRIGRELCAPPVAHLESAHASQEPALPRAYSGAYVEPASAVLTVMKEAEDGAGSIVRVFDASGHGASASVELPLVGARFVVALAPHEVASKRIDAGGVAEIDLVEASGHHEASGYHETSGHHEASGHQWPP